MGEKMTHGTRVRVYFPDEAWARFDRAAKVLALDESSIVRVFASLYLAQWEAQTGGLLRAPELRDAVAGLLDVSAAGLFPEAEK
jgi:hypothetical protein